MSVLIRGMDMPKSCGDCKAFVCYRKWAGDTGDCFCGITKSDANEKIRNADCPLVPATNMRPVVRGKWEWNKNNGFYYCSKCGTISPREDQDGEYCDCPNFCHNCGADMRESTDG